MARRSREYRIPPNPQGIAPGDPRWNRDAGKLFILTEWDAFTAETWATRAIIAIGNSGAKIDYVRGMGMMGIAALGLQALFGVQEGAALQLLNELMQCVTIKEEIAVRMLTPDDVEEVATRLQLKWEVFALHTGFTSAELLSNMISATRLAGLSIIQMFPPQSAKPSAKKARKPRSRNSRRR